MPALIPAPTTNKTQRNFALGWFPANRWWHAANQTPVLEETADRRARDAQARFRDIIYLTITTGVATLVFMLIAAMTSL